MKHCLFDWRSKTIQFLYVICLTAYTRRFRGQTTAGALKQGSLKSGKSLLSKFMPKCMVFLHVVEIKSKFLYISLERSHLVSSGFGKDSRGIESFGLGFRMPGKIISLPFGFNAFESQMP